MTPIGLLTNGFIPTSPISILTFGLISPDTNTGGSSKYVRRRFDVQRLVREDNELIEIITAMITGRLL